MPRIAARGRLRSFAIALVLLASVLAVRAADSSSSRDLAGARLAAGTTWCPDVLLAVVPGDAEGSSTTPVSAGRTIGRFESTYVRAVKATGRTVQAHVIPFRTARLSTLLPSNRDAPANRSITVTMARRYAAGTDTARDTTLTLLANRARSCPGQSIVLAGYGQGASVVHRVLRQLGTGATSRRIIGAALFSDPDRNPNTAALRWGRPAAGGTAHGILRATKVRTIGDVPYPGSFPRVISACRQLDVVCDFRGQKASLGVSLAGSYYHYNLDQLDAAANDLATRTRAIPDPRPAVTTVYGTAGTPLRTQLVADVMSRFADDLRWSATSTFPPGLSLSSSGVVSGTPSAIGSWTVSYTVRNTGRAAFDRPIRGTLVVKVGGSAPGFTSAGGDTSCAIPTSGALWCWGDNYEGQLGIGSRTNQTKPVRLGTTTGWVSVDTGGTHTCAIKTSGALWCWGRNDYGQVGDGTRTRELRPVRVGSGRLWSQVSTNTHHTCAIARDGSLWCWGFNDNGQLGVGDRSTRVWPTRVGSLTGWASVSTGAQHTCAIRTNGSALCWGDNRFGQLGLGDSTRRLVPVRVGWNYAQVSAGGTHTCAVTTTGQAQCWGANTNGQLGDGTNTLRATPVAVADGASYLQVDAGLLSSCGVTSAHQVRCWGAGWVGTLGAGDVDTSSTPVTVSSSTDLRRVQVGWGHACATAGSGATDCWGFNSAGQIGDGSHHTTRTPLQVIS